ncbi:MAG: hypothetical protein JXR27_02860 [Paludibacteraceae bacterium]|nr:hypothetical protein [Paludibacteraceae bacterium]
MKIIQIPYSDALNTAGVDNAVQILEENGRRLKIDSLNWPEVFPYKPITYCNIAYSSQSLFLRFFVWGNMLKAVYYTDQSTVYEDSCVAFFCKLPGEAEYRNFEFNCIGTCSASVRKGRDEAVEPFSPDKMKLIKRLPSITPKAFNELSGHFEWDLTVEIPFELIGVDAENLPEFIDANFYKCADKTEFPHFVSWNKIETESPDFHRPEFFGRLYFD